MVSRHRTIYLIRRSQVRSIIRRKHKQKKARSWLNIYYNLKMERIKWKRFSRIPRSKFIIRTTRGMAQLIRDTAIVLIGNHPDTLVKPDPSNDLDPHSQPMALSYPWIASRINIIKILSSARSKSLMHSLITTKKKSKIILSIKTINQSQNNNNYIKNYLHGHHKEPRLTDKAAT